MAQFTGVVKLWHNLPSPQLYNNNNNLQFANKMKVKTDQIVDYYYFTLTFEKAILYRTFGGYNENSLITIERICRAM